MTTLIFGKVTAVGIAATAASTAGGLGVLAGAAMLAHSAAEAGAAAKELGGVRS